MQASAFPVVGADKCEVAQDTYQCCNPWKETCKNLTLSQGLQKCCLKGAHAVTGVDWCANNRPTICKSSLHNLQYAVGWHPTAGHLPVQQAHTRFALEDIPHRRFCMCTLPLTHVPGSVLQMTSCAETSAVGWDPSASTAMATMAWTRAALKEVSECHRPMVCLAARGKRGHGRKCHRNTPLCLVCRQRLPVKHNEQADLLPGGHVWLHEWHAASVLPSR